MRGLNSNRDASSKWLGKPRVLHVGKFYPAHTGGFEKHLHALCTELRKSIDVRVVVARDDMKVVEETLAGATASRMATPLSLLSAPRRQQASLKISGAGAQFVHIHLPNPAAVLSYLASGYQGRFVVTYHSDTVRERFLATCEPLLLSPYGGVPQ